MRIAYLDCFSGISGDMFLGALLDAGVPFGCFEKTVADLNIGARWKSRASTAVALRRLSSMWSWAARKTCRVRSTGRSRG